MATSVTSAGVGRDDEHIICLVLPILVRNNRTNEIRMEIENVHIAHIIMIFIYFSLNLAEYAECVAASFEGDIRQRGEVRLFPCLRFFFFCKLLYYYNKSR